MTDPSHPPLLSPEEALERLKSLARPWAEGEYLAFYSSWLGGVVTEPWLMSVPVDDHLVHRGDGVFEACKCEKGRIFQFRAHLERLARSAASIHLVPPLPIEAIGRLAVNVARLANTPDCMVRLYLSRGPGGFTTNPFECPTPGIYIVISRFHYPSPQAYQNGVRVGLVPVPAKSGFFAAVKSCNYLPNVLLKREAITRGWDYSLGLDPEGRLTEGSTENFALVDDEGCLVVPKVDGILEGTTAKLVLAHARELVAEGRLAGVDHRDLTPEDLARAREIMLVGTTLDVLPVTYLDGDQVGDGRPGPVAAELLARLRRDITDNPKLSTPVFSD